MTEQAGVEIKAVLHHSVDSGRTRAGMKGAREILLIDADLICLDCTSRSGGQGLIAALWSSVQKGSYFSLSDRSLPSLCLLLFFLMLLPPPPPPYALLSKELITYAVYSKHADLCQCSREEGERTEKMEEKWNFKNGNYLTFHNVARRAGIILVFGWKKKINMEKGKTPPFTIGLSPPSLHPCRAPAPTIHHGDACKNSPPSLLSLSLRQIKKKYCI